MLVQAVYGARVVWETDQTHAARPGVVETCASSLPPAVPVLSMLVLDEAVVGYVTHIVPAGLQRFLIAYHADLPTARELCRWPYQPTPVAAEVAVTPPGAEAMVVGIDALRPYLPARVWATVVELGFLDAPSVCALADEALLQIEGIGSKSLDAIRQACDAVEF